MKLLTTITLALLFTISSFAQNPYKLQKCIDIILPTEVTFDGAYQLNPKVVDWDSVWVKSDTLQITQITGAVSDTSYSISDYPYIQETSVFDWDSGISYMITLQRTAIFEYLTKTINGTILVIGLNLERNILLFRYHETLYRIEYTTSMFPTITLKLEAIYEDMKERSNQQ